MDSTDSSANLTPLERDADDIEIALEKLEGDDIGGHLGELAAAVGGAAAGGAAAGIVASAAGASTLLGSTALASWVGGVLVVTTPAGWVVGCAAIGGATAFGIAKLVRSGGRQDEVRRSTRERLKRRLVLGGRRGQACEYAKLSEQLDDAVRAGALVAGQASRIKQLVDAGKLDAGRALERVAALLKERVASP